MVRTGGSQGSRRKGLLRSVILGVVVYAGLLAFVQYRLNPPLEHVGKTVMVHSGQTVWQIASEFYPKENTNQAVYAIMSANKLTHANDLQPGQTLYLP